MKLSYRPGITVKDMAFHIPADTAACLLMIMTITAVIAALN